MPSGTNKKLSVVSYNMWFLSIRLFGLKLLEPATFLDQRLKRLPHALKKSNTDVVLLQEVYSERRKNHIIDKVKKTYPYSVYYKKKFKFDWSLQNGLMILSKHPIVNHNFVKFKNLLPHERFMLNKWFLCADIQVSSKKIVSIINGHNVARWIFRDEKAGLVVSMKAKQIQQIVDYAEIRSIDIVAGDYNCGPDFFPHIYGVFKHAGFLEAFDIKYPKKTFVTWDSSNPLTQTKFFADTPPQKDDHIFLAKKHLNKYKITDTKIVFDEKFITIKWNKYPLSDHYGVCAILDLK